MSDSPNLIPPPAVVRGRLARNIRERRLLRSLLRLAIRATQEAEPFPHPEAETVRPATGKEAGRAR